MVKNLMNLMPKSDPYGKGCLSSLKIEGLPVEKGDRDRDREGR